MRFYVHERPATKEFLFFDGTNVENAVAFIADAGFVITSQSETDIVFEGWETMTLSAGEYILAEATQWGPQALIFTAEQMNKKYFPASTLPPVVE